MQRDKMANKKHFHVYIFLAFIVFGIWLFVLTADFYNMQHIASEAPQYNTQAALTLTQDYFEYFLLQNGYSWKCDNWLNNTTEQFVDDSYDIFCSYKICVQQCGAADIICHKDITSPRDCNRETGECYHNCEQPSDGNMQKQDAVRNGCYKPAHFENVTQHVCEYSQLIRNR
jgi:hypothetical protein